MSDTARALVLLSGGIDSFATAHTLKAEGYDVHGLFVEYGQATSVYERRASLDVAQWLNVPHQAIRIEGGPSFHSGEILGRNLLLISIALTFSDNKYEHIALGLHAGTPYFDCSQAFISHARKLVEETSNGRKSILCPFLRDDKNHIFGYVQQNALPIGITHSCELGSPPCGGCLSCMDRAIFQC
jgi:7-cyano-7-deazaguanine synthase